MERLCRFDWGKCPLTHIDLTHGSTSGEAQTEHTQNAGIGHDETGKYAKVQNYISEHKTQEVLTLKLGTAGKYSTLKLGTLMFKDRRLLILIH
jgi:hypothetical protein